LLDCIIDNEGSNKIILALGGKLEKTEIDPSDNTMTNYYLMNQ
jgi:predicted acetyltransferase